jgi:hypothetical protein
MVDFADKMAREGNAFHIADGKPGEVRRPIRLLE